MDLVTGRLPNYQLGEQLGRGAFGQVFKALNWTTGETVAVKQIGLSNIPQSELPDLMSEINLLKNLDHPNIVQYRGSSRNADYLYIILEYCENGSLHGIIKRFGKFPESLVAQYICQVLDGLQYLHDQGVIHRDIKGSNILATKEGSVKLADFGVATRTGPLKDSAVVGSPYWMAPEVIDQSGATTASDIWSVGAVVVELLQGNPPYSDLDPMPALFRIVNDDCPPLPEATSAMCRDFLLQCFQKDCNLRVTARKLLRHPWMMAARRHLDLTKREQQPRNPRNLNNYDETVYKVQEWNKALEAHQTTLPPRLVSRSSDEVKHALQAKMDRTIPDKNHGVQHDILHQESDNTATVRQRRGTVKANQPPPFPVSAIDSSAQKHNSVEKDSTGADADNSNWDEDFEEGIPTLKIAALEKPRVVEGHSQNKGISAPLEHLDDTAALPADDYSDLIVDEASFQGRVARMRSASGSRARLLHPRDLSKTSAHLVHHYKASSRLSAIATDSSTIKANPRTPKSIADYVEIAEEEDDYSSLFGQADATSTSVPSRLQLTDRLSGNPWLGEDMDEEDPFADVEEAENLNSLDGLKTNMARDQLARLNGLVLKFIDGMPASDCPDSEINELCLQLVDHLDGEIEGKRLFLKENGVLALLEGLQLRKSKDCVGSMLRILNIVCSLVLITQFLKASQIVSDDPAALEKLCLLGGCPIVMNFASTRYSRDIRLEAALFIGSVCRTSLMTLQMFISCRGLRVLVNMMDQSYSENRDLVWMAVDGILRVVEMQGSAPRNEFCRVLAQEGLLVPLSRALISAAKDEDELAESAKVKAVQVLVVFGQADVKVREAMATRSVAASLVKVVKFLHGELLVALLKTIKNISMSAKAVDVLQNANAIEVLVTCLLDHLPGPLHTEVANPVVNALYNLCRLSKVRQEEASSYGVVPALMGLARSSSPLKQFALPMLCDFPGSGKNCRKVLWQHDGLQFFLDLLQDPFWASSAIDSIAVWLAEEFHRVEDVLLQPLSTRALVLAFDKAKSTTFENLLEPLLKILRLSTALCIAFTNRPEFLSRLTARLQAHNKPIVRLGLLRIIKTAVDCVPPSARRKVFKTPGLMVIIKNLALSDSALLVRQLAKGLADLDNQPPTMPTSTMVRSRSIAGNMPRMIARGKA